jgi:hypothetical protein
MASILKVDTLTGVTTAGSISVTGEGNSTTTNLQQGLAKAWVRYNGTGTAAINDSFNTASIVDNATGDYTFAFSSSMNNSNFACNATSKEVDGTAANSNGTGVMPHSYATGSFRVLNFSPDGNSRDPAVGNTSTMGDLA